MTLVSACMTVDITVNPAYLLAIFHYRQTSNFLSATAKGTQLNNECSFAILLQNIHTGKTVTESKVINQQCCVKEQIKEWQTNSE